MRIFQLIDALVIQIAGALNDTSHWEQLSRSLRNTAIFTCLFYLLLLVGLRRVNRRARIAWAVCFPVSLLISDFQSAFHLNEILHMPSLVLDLVSCLIILLPFAFMGPREDGPAWIRQRKWLIIAVALLPVVAVSILFQFWPQILRPSFVIPAVLIVVLLCTIPYFLRTQNVQTRPWIFAVGVLFVAVGITLAVATHMPAAILTYALGAEIAFAIAILLRLARSW